MNPLERARKKIRSNQKEVKERPTMELSQYMLLQYAKYQAIKSLKKYQDVRVHDRSFNDSLFIEAAEKFLMLTGDEPRQKRPPDPDTLAQALRELRPYTYDALPEEFTQEAYDKWLAIRKGL